MKYFCIWDRRAESAGHLFHAPSMALAQRQLDHASREKDSLYGFAPEDFEVRYVGEFDETSLVFKQEG